MKSFLIFLTVMFCSSILMAKKVTIIVEPPDNNFIQDENCNIELSTFLHLNEVVHLTDEKFKWRDSIILKLNKKGYRVNQGYWIKNVYQKKSSNPENYDSRIELIITRNITSIMKAQNLCTSKMDFIVNGHVVSRDTTSGSGYFKIHCNDEGFIDALPRCEIKK